MNINQQIEALLAALETAQPKNTLLVADNLPIFFADLRASQAKVKLTDAESTASTATVQRIEIEERVDRFIRALRHSYAFLHTGEDLPDWIKRGSETTVETYTEFFTGIESADADLIAKAEGLATPQTAAEIKSLQTEWQSAHDQETLQQQAIDKVRNAIDLRAAVIGLLRYVGMTGSVIAELTDE